MTKKILVWIVLFCWHIIVANLIFLLSLKIAGIKDQAEGDLFNKFFKSLFFGEINGIQFGPFTTLSTIGVLIYSRNKNKIYDSFPPKGIYNWFKYIVLSPILAFLIGSCFGA